MKLALREEMSRGRTLAERLSWLDGLGFDGIELTTSVDLPPGSSRRSLLTRMSGPRTSLEVGLCWTQIPPSGPRRRI